MRAPLTHLGFALHSANLDQPLADEFVSGVVRLLSPVATENPVRKPLTNTAVKQAKQLAEQEVVVRDELEDLFQKHQGTHGGRGKWTRRCNAMCFLEICDGISATMCVRVFKSCALGVYRCIWQLNLGFKVLGFARGHIPPCGMHKLLMQL